MKAYDSQPDFGDTQLYNTRVVRVYLYSTVITTEAPASNHSAFIFPSDFYQNVLSSLADAPLSVKSHSVFNMLL